LAALEADDCMRMPTNGDFPWERDERGKRSQRQLRRSRRVAGLRTAMFSVLVAAGVAGIVKFGVHGGRAGAGIGAPHGALPGAYVAVPGPWHWRWVRVKNPPSGTPHYVRQRYRTIRYVGAPKR